MTRNSHLFLFGLLVACAPSHGADWPCWRGPQYDGISCETGVTLPWQASPKVLWELPTGAAFSAVTGVGDLVYTCGTEDGQQVLLCLGAGTGEVVWKRTFAGGVKDRQGGDGTRATPTLDEGRVYIFGGEGTLLCAAAKTGDEIWSKKFGNAPRWKYSGSVLIEGDMAVVSPGGADGGLLALNKENGEVIWKGGEGGAGYATPYPFTFDGTRYMVGVLGKKVIIVVAETGREVWSMPWVTSYDVNAATPIFNDGHLFISSGYGHGCILLRLQADGDRLTTTAVWESKAILNKFQTCILLDGKLYGADERNLKCVDFLTGEEAWSLNRVAGDGTKYGTLVLCQGHFIFLSQSGQLSVAKASPEGFDAVGTTQVLSGRCWTVPTIHNGRLYVRNLDKLVCLELGE
ncbi:MAG: PQQ-like beta-propeller repeat protein [Planctomycetes bacterium]|nr:PQQ-like beta-propeller repeat protein [Planctomycetota bacterium]MBL7037795.1 PQQ-like beta-propeller repeat protein [Pirellulaceae bacterium]